jgi:hypothetical protein
MWTALQDESRFDELLGTYPNGRLVVDDDDMFIGMSGRSSTWSRALCWGKAPYWIRMTTLGFHTKPGYEPSSEVFKAVAMYDDVEEKLSMLIMKTRSLVP